MPPYLTNAAVLLLTALYVLLADGYARRFLGGRTRLDALSRPLFVGTVIVHLGVLVLRGIETETCPVIARWEAFSFVAFAMAMIQLILELRRGKRRVGVFVLVPVALLQFLSAVFILGSGAVETAGSPQMIASLHAFAAYLGISGSAVAGIHGVLYVLLHRAIRQGRYGNFFQRMPSLEDLSDLNASAAATGFFAWTVAVGIGIRGALIGAAEAQGIELPVVPIVLTFLVWILFGACGLAHRLRRFGGVRFAWCMVAGLALTCALLLSVGSRGVHG